MFSFIHAADIHLDSPLKGLFRYEGAPDVEEIRGATRQALDNLVTLVLSEKAPLLIIAGDLYDGDWQDFNTGTFSERTKPTRLSRACLVAPRISSTSGAPSYLNKPLSGESK